MKTLIHGGDVVAHAAGSHRLLRNGALVFEDDRVTFVGRAFAGPVDRRIDATGKLVIPGLVNIHCHADVEAGGRLIADVGRRDYFHTGFLNYYGARKGAKSLGPRQDPEVGGRFAMAEMLRNGCTTVVDIGVAAESHARIAGELGLPRSVLQRPLRQVAMDDAEPLVTVERGRLYSGPPRLEEP